ncbi:hypothetical protein AeMF1_002680 [Aphanomyces euteiches]|nr:hypothetical protein AeMF1_002680 [Aphanomyces euteiches]KAH9185857.1 hypothetical protein AeNC1_012165 [Aphanomyces euteiches]
MVKSEDVAKRLNTGQLVKSYWSFVTKNDVAGLDLFLQRHIHEIDMDLRLPAAMQATGLHVAAQKNNVEMAILLLKYGVNVNAQNKLGSTALHLACKQGFTEIIRILIDHHADFGILDTANKAPFEVATWEHFNEIVLTPLRKQVETMASSENECRRMHDELEEECERMMQRAEQSELEYEDVLSARLEEWMAYRAMCQLQDDRRSHLIEVNRTLRQRDVQARDQRLLCVELHAQLEDAVARYRVAIAQADESKQSLDKQRDQLANLYRIKESETQVFNDKLGIVDAMVCLPSDEVVQVWGAYMTCCLTEDVAESNLVHGRLVMQRIFPALRDAMERFPFNMKLQEFAIESARQICTALPRAIQECMEERFVENMLVAARRFRDDVCFLQVCVAALRAIFHPLAATEPLSGAQIKHTAKFAAEKNDFLIELLVRAKSQAMPKGMVEDLCCVLFVLAKYNCRQIFLDNDCIGLDTALFFLVESTKASETMIRSLLGIVSLLSIADSKLPEEEPLPACYTTFGLNKVTPLLQEYSGNPDIVSWGIRLVRNLAQRDAVAKEQANRSGIEHVLSGLAERRGAPALRISILQLIYVAFTTNYNRLQQVEELSTMVLRCDIQCLLDHEDNEVVQEWAVKNLVVSAQHESNLEFIMEFHDSIEKCLLQMLAMYMAQMPTAMPKTVCEVVMWSLRLLVAICQHGLPQIIYPVPP